MPNIIRDRSAVSSASMDDLNHTFRELKGQPDFQGLSTRSAAEGHIDMAIMAAQNAAGHVGVPKGQQPQALTASELAAAKNPYKEGTMSHSLYEAVNQQQPITPRAEKKEVARRIKIDRVRFVPSGQSRPQAGSLRNQVLQFVAAAPGRTASVAELEEHFKVPVRGYLQKLIEKGHLAIVEVAS